MAMYRLVPSASSYSVGALKSCSFAARYPACTFSCQRFVAVLAGGSAWLGAGVGRYSFTV
jgi:hypothetical protein